MERALLCLLLVGSAAYADVRLPAVISDHMVLQRNTPVRVWGWADPGEGVTVKMAGQTVGVAANLDGRWQVFLKAMDASGPHEMTVSGRNTLTVKDVLVGEVWVASGQSNMAMTVARSNNAAAETAAANYPRIRFFQVPQAPADAPQEDVKAVWKVCSPETAGSFSATAYYFVRELHQGYKVPFGVLQSAVGGTPAEAWTPLSWLVEELTLAPLLQKYAQAVADFPTAQARYQRQLAEWNKTPAASRPANARAPQPPVGPGHRNMPAGLYNGMIAPLIPYTIKGAIWYQGENNASSGRGDLYNRLLETMIRSWREAWGQGDFPFLWVQLPNFIHRSENSHWPEVQDGMRRTLALRNTGMAVTIDIGDPNDIHPTNKQDVGKRLARVGRAAAYGEPITSTGPLFTRAIREGATLRVFFDQTGGALKTRDGAPVVKAFEIAWGPGPFRAAEARIDGDTVVVSVPDGREPTVLRYAWGGNPETNLVNTLDLPASPFRAEVR